jgi:hypothetical protein
MNYTCNSLQRLLEIWFFTRIVYSNQPMVTIYLYQNDCSKINYNSDQSNDNENFINVDDNLVTSEFLH